MKFRYTSKLLIAGLLFWTGSVYALGFSGVNVSNQVSRTVSRNIAKNLTDRMLMPQLKIHNESGEIKNFSVSVDNRFFTLLHEDNTVRVWDAKQGVQRPVISSKGHDISKVKTVSSLYLTLLGRGSGVIDVYDVYTGKREHRLKSIDEEIVALSVSKDETLLIAAHENGELILWDLNKLSKIKSIKTPYDDDLKFVKIESNGLTFVLAGEDGFVDRWDIKKGVKMGVIKSEVNISSGYVCQIIPIVIPEAIRSVKL